MKNKNTLGSILWILIIIAIIWGAYFYYDNYNKDISNNINNNINNNNTTNQQENNTNQQDYDKEQDISKQPTLPPLDEVVKLPDFEMESLAGDKVNFYEEYGGKLVFLNFWTTTCPYCVKEMPDFEKVNKRFAKDDKAIVVTVNLGEDRQIVQKFMDKHKFDLPVLMDKTGQIYNGSQGVPVTFVIRPDGTLYNAIPGMTDEKTILSLATEILK